MITLTVIIHLCLFASQHASGFEMRKYSRSVDTSQFTPQSPCPTVFQYQNGEDGNLIGAIRVDRADQAGKVQLDVELSVGNSVQGYNGKITLADDRQKVINDIMNKKPIFYKVHFPPWQNIPPRVTQILVNGNQICSGSRIPIQMVPVLTTINLQHKLSLGVTPLISSADGDSNLSPVFGTQDNSGSSPESNTNPFLNSNNPYNFNPPPRQPPDDRPPPDRRPPPDDRWPPPDNRWPPPDNRRPPPDDRRPPPDDRRPPPDDRRPPPDDRRPPPNNRPPPDEGNAFPENPFLVGQTPDSAVDVFGTRTTETPSVFTTRPPSRNGDSSYNDICGRPIATNSLIVNGQNVPRGAYPWLVAIFRQLDNLSLSYICSGSLISDRHVVTAAHCVKLEYRRVKPSEIVCIFGKLNIRKWVTVPGERMLEPEAIIVHPDYETGKANADIAVLTFQEIIPFNKMIRPVCLWQGPTDLAQVVGNIGIVVGWGRDENGDLSTAEPRQVNMPIVDHLECLKGSSTSVGQALVEIVSKNTFCAGFRNGSGPCNGDSGSAFLLRKSGVFYLRGIVSTALSEVTHKSCNLQEYVVFADASKYLDWLTRIIRQN